MSASPEPELMVEITESTASAVCGDALEQLTEDLNHEEWPMVMERAGRIAEIAEAIEAAKAST